MKIVIVNLGQIVSGDWRNPFVSGDAIAIDDDQITSVGNVATAVANNADVLIDAGGMTAIPGLIDSHVHITFGDYTPRHASVPSAILKAMCMAAPRPRFPLPRFMFPAGQAMSKA